VQHDRERALPTGTTELVFNLGAERMRIFKDELDEFGRQFKRSVVCGPHSRYFVLDTSQSTPALGAHFRAGGASAFFCPNSEISESTVELEEIWGSRARDLHEILLHNASSTEQLFRVVEEALRSHLGSKLTELHPAVDYAVHQLIASPALHTVSKLEDETGYSPKHFIQLFRASVGLTPKVFSRIQRFQTAIARIARRERIDWAALAVDSGYYDQSHLNREFRVFAGMTPGEYEPVSRERPSHVPA